MGRVPRIQVENAVYYISSGGDNNEPIFMVPNDSATYLGLLNEYKNQYHFKLFAYCIVPETISLLIEPSPNTTISSIMHDLNSKYTKYFNRKYGKSGHLFQERYRMVLIEKSSKLLEMTAYINLKPKLHTPPYNVNTYSYSSYKAYMKEGGMAGGPDIGEEVKEVLSYLNGATYQDIVAQMALDKLSELGRELASKFIIGSEKFVKEVKSRMSSLRARPSRHCEEAPEPQGFGVNSGRRSNLAFKEIASAASRPRNDEESLGPEPEQLLEPAPEHLSQPKPEPISDAAPVFKPKSNMVKSVLAAVLIIITILGASIFAHTKTMHMKERLDNELAKKDSELKSRLDEERKNLYKTLTDRYESEKAAYQETTQRLESEKEALRASAERLLLEKNSYQEMAKRLSDEKASYQQAAERLLLEKNSYKKTAERLEAEKDSYMETIKRLGL